MTPLTVRENDTIYVKIHSQPARNALSVCRNVLRMSKLNNSLIQSKRTVRRSSGLQCRN